MIPVSLYYSTQLYICIYSVLYIFFLFTYIIEYLLHHSIFLFYDFTTNHIFYIFINNLLYENKFKNQYVVINKMTYFW